MWFGCFGRIRRLRRGPGPLQGVSESHLATLDRSIPMRS